MTDELLRREPVLRVACAWLRYIDKVVGLWCGVDQVPGAATLARNRGRLRDSEDRAGSAGWASCLTSYFVGSRWCVVRVLG